MRCQADPTEIFFSQIFRWHFWTEIQWLIIIGVQCIYSLCSRIQFKKTFCWHGTLSCWSIHQKKNMVVIKEWPQSATRLRWAGSQCSIGTKNPKVCQENMPHTIIPPLPVWTFNTRQDGFKLLCHVHQMLNYHPNVIDGIQIYHTRY